MRKLVFALAVGSLAVSLSGCKPGTYYPFGGPSQIPHTNEKATLFYTNQYNAKQLPAKHDKNELVVPG